ncbi:MAG: EMC3/TMCO1 family protein [Candidatus Thorarchaeota archaeon]
MQTPLLDFILEWASHPPGSAVVILFVSMTITIMSNLATKRFTDVPRMKRYSDEIKAYQELSKQANKTQNEKLLRKVRRRKAYIDRIQKEMFTSRCKPLAFFFIPFMAIFYSLSGFYTDHVGGVNIPRVVAVVPFSVHKLLPFLDGFIGTAVDGGFGLYFFGFYALVGLGLGQIIQRMQGIRMT